MPSLGVDTIRATDNPASPTISGHVRYDYGHAANFSFSPNPSNGRAPVLDGIVVQALDAAGRPVLGAQLWLLYDKSGRDCSPYADIQTSCQTGGAIRLDGIRIDPDPTGLKRDGGSVILAYAPLGTLPVAGQDVVTAHDHSATGQGALAF